MAPDSPAARTRALTAVLTLTAAGLLVVGPAGAVLSGSPDGPAVPALLTAGFLLAELLPLHIEVRREAMSVTLAGVPLALAVLLCGPREAVLARLLGSAAVFALQRVNPVKAGYNLAAYAFDTALGLALVHAVLPPQAGSGRAALGLATAVTCLVVLALVDQLMGLLVVVVITWFQGAPGLREVLGLQLSGLLTSALATTAAYGLVLLGGQGPVGLVVLVVFTGASGVAYRGVRVLHRRHQALAHVHAFVALDNDTGRLEDLAGGMLEAIRDLMRAGRAELVLTGPDPLHLSVGEDGRPAVVTSAALDRELDEVLVDEGPALLHRRTRDRRHRAWLDRQGVDDAVVVPVLGPGSARAGALLVLDRLGDTGSFTPEDLTLLRTLAGHLGVAVSSARRRERLQYEATHDVLTGLGNRALLAEAARAQLAAPDRAQAFVLLLDLDRFKEVNDTFGHHVGDTLLTVIGSRLRAVLPAHATVVRLGGDEFAALVPTGGAAGPPGLQARQLALEVGRALGVPVELPDATLSTRASIGVALATPGLVAADLLRHADTAMYAAKASGADCVVYTAELDRGRAERLALLADLHLALERDELTVLYQPKLDLRSDRVTGVEALVRWQHPRLGTLGPDVFIPIAEANGLVGPLTHVVLRAALRQCAAWRAEGLDLTVAVNLSARTVNDPELPERINAALLAAGVPASRLVLEVTESAVMEDPDRAVAILGRIAAVGIGLSLDDFGTGYSSLSYLQRLPVCEVKVDRSFVTGLTGGDASGQVLVRSIISLGHSLGLRVVAEGVEDAATLDLLQGLDCDLVQGYHLSRPETAARVAALVRARAVDRRPLRAVSG